MPAARPAALLIALGIALTCAGCGGADGSGSASVTTTAPKGSGVVDEAVFVRRAEAICRRSVAKTRALGRQLPQILASAPTPQQGITYGLVRSGIAILDEQATALRNLGPPPESPLLATYLGLFDPILELARQRFQAGTEGDLERARQLELMVGDLGEEQSAAAKELGLRACGIEFNTALGATG